MYYPILRSDAQRQLKEIGTADLVIGLFSYKNAQVAAPVAKTALAGAHRHYPHLRTVLIDVDAGWNAETRRAIMAQASKNGHNHAVVCGRYRGVLGQGSAVAALLDAALALNAGAILMLDSRTECLTPDWIAALSHLILAEKADLVMPRYRQWEMPARMLSDLIVYPLFRALWGQSIRHPAAPDFAVSPEMAAALLDEDVWGTEVGKSGLMPWLTTFATQQKWRVAQSAVGEKFAPIKSATRDGRAEQHRFRAEFHDVVSVLFSMLYRYQKGWQNIAQVQSVPTLTQFAAPAKPAAGLHIDPVQLLDELALGWMEHRRLWKQFLTAKNMARIEMLAALPPDQFFFPSDFWAKIIFDFAVGFSHLDVDPVQVVEALFPLYQGRLAAFWHEIAGLAAVGREGTVAAQAVEFEEARPYLKMRWQKCNPRRYQADPGDKPSWLR